MKTISYFLSLAIISVFAMMQFSFAGNCPLSVKTNVLPETGNYMYNGGIEITVTGGVAPYLCYYFEMGTPDTLVEGTGDSIIYLGSLRSNMYHIEIVDETDTCRWSTYINVPLQQGGCNINMYGYVGNAKGVSSNDGYIEVMVNNYQGYLQFLWSDSVTSQNRYGLNPGMYSLTVTDTSGCSASNTWEVLLEQGNGECIQLNPSITNATSDTSFNGSIYLSVTGGVYPYTFIWANGDTTTNGMQYNLGKGFYMVTVKDADTCKVVREFEIKGSQQNCFIEFSVSKTDETFPYGKDGSIVLYPMSGSYPYSYYWSDGYYIENRYNLSPGYYGVTITDANNCKYINSWQIMPYGGGCNMLINGSVTHPTLPGASTGSINVNVQGFIPPLYYAWSHGPSGQYFNWVDALSAGNYTVTITDSSYPPCVKTKDFVLTDPIPQCMYVTEYLYNPSVVGGNDGSISLNVNGGVAPYYFMWSNGITTMSNDTLAAGFYSVTITDSDTVPCKVVKYYDLKNPNCNLYVMGNTIPASWGQADGQILLNVMGYNSNYYCLWSDNNTDINRYNLTAGSYQVTVTDMAGCKQVRYYEVQQGSCLTVSHNITQPSVPGANDGVVNLNVNGGKAPYNFVWSNGKTGNPINNVSAGSYYVTVTDSDTVPCRVVYDFWVYDPDTNQQNCTFVIIPTIDNENPMGAKNGAVRLMVQGGQGPIMYKWDNGMQSPNRFGLGAGWYTVTISDQSGCKKIENYEVKTEGQGNCSMDIYANITPTQQGLGIGVIELSPSYFVPPVSYVWSDGWSSQNRFNLYEGSYRVTATDYSGCKVVREYFVSSQGTIGCLTVNHTIMQPDMGAFNGSIYLTVGGGKPPYMYTWSNGSFSPSLFNIGAGYYNVTITDSDSCSFVGYYDVYEKTGDPCLWNVTANVNSETFTNANDGSIDVMVQGGTYPYIFTWNDTVTDYGYRWNLAPGTYSVTVTQSAPCSSIRYVNNSLVVAPYDSNACHLYVEAMPNDETAPNKKDGSINLYVSQAKEPVMYLWNDGSAISNRVNLSAGYYTVTVLDDKGCKQIVSTQVKVMPPKTCKAMFSFSVDSIQKKVFFNNMSTSTAQMSYIWTFDNWGTSYDRNPQQVFATEGIYNVCLNMYDELGCYDYICKPVQVGNAIGSCFAQFNVLTDTINTNVSFNNTSLGKLNTWYWDFGDGNYAYVKNPTHNYARPGLYNVYLTVGDSITGCYNYAYQYIAVGDITNACAADFSYWEDASGNVNFYSLSQGDIKSWYWQFGDGKTSYLEKPVYKYTTPGYYNVKLTISTVKGCQSTKTYQVLYGDIQSLCKAEFTYLIDTTGNIKFADKSSSNTTSWYWYFGDGEYSYEKNPAHRYRSNGFYNVYLYTNDSITGCYSWSEQQLQIGDINSICQAEFNYFVDSTKTVQFTDISRGNISTRFWDFGDGYTSKTQNPSHTFAIEGYYNVSLATYDAATGCQSYVTYNIQVGDISNLCKAKFNHMVEGDAVVKFNNTSVGSSNNYYWSFGDGYDSYEKNPQHTYSDPGYYYVYLSSYDTVTGCMSWDYKGIQVGKVVEFCQAYFWTYQNADTIVFSDNSMGNIAKRVWDFGDGTISYATHPTHVYKNDGVYNVTLTVSDSAATCASTYSDYVRVGDFAATCQTDFNVVINPDNSVVFSDASKGNPDQWYWYFGDGGWSTEKNPKYTYQRPGLYYVSLYTTNSVNGCYNSTYKEVKVNYECKADFTFVLDEQTNKVQFKNNSKGNADYVYWSFGDGYTETINNPNHTYAGGVYEAWLTIYNTNTGCSDYTSKQIKVGDLKCVSKFTANVDPTTKKITLKDQSIGAVDSWYWEMGDYNSSSLRNTTHTYANAGLYNVCLTAANYQAGCMDRSCQSIQVGTIECSAKFRLIIDATTRTVKCRNNVLGASTLLYWSFGDGGWSTDANPVYTYPKAGIFYISLSTYDLNTGCMDYYSEKVVVGSMGDDCEASFIFQTDDANKSATFYNKSIGSNLNKYTWSFNDGYTDNVENPTHQYFKGGVYNVCLNVSSTTTGCKNTTCQYVKVGDNDYCQAKFNYAADTVNLKVSFSDKSMGTPNTYLWDFGDGTTSTAKNPVHQYATGGLYLISYSITNSNTGCSSWAYDLVSISQPNTGIKGGFGFNIDPSKKKANAVPVDFVGAAFGDPAVFEWNFGDGSSDDLDWTPTHEYTESGDYDVCLTVSDPLINQSHTSCQTISVTLTDVKENNTIGMDIYPNPVTEHSTLSYTVSKAQKVQIEIYGITGVKISTLVNQQKSEGLHTINLSNQQLSAGVYMVHMNAGNQKMIKKLVVLE